MASLMEFPGKRIYLDANIFIYALESLDPWGHVAQTVLGDVERGRCHAVTSELCLAECLVKPLQLGQRDSVAFYMRGVTSSAHLSVVPVRRDVLIEAAGLRACMKRVA